MLEIFCSRELSMSDGSRGSSQAAGKVKEPGRKAVEWFEYPTLNQSGDEWFDFSVSVLTNRKKSNEMLWGLIIRWLSLSQNKTGSYSILLTCLRVLLNKVVSALHAFTALHADPLNFLLTNRFQVTVIIFHPRQTLLMGSKSAYLLVLRNRV